MLKIWWRFFWHRLETELEGAEEAGRISWTRPTRVFRRPGEVLGVLLFCGWVASGCASYTEETREIRAFYRGGAYAKALEELEASSLKSEDRNRLLYRMEKGSILERMERRSSARNLWIEADKIADELYTVSVSRTAASFIVNEGFTDYEGEDYEKVGIHTQMALSFLADGDLGGARVAAKKINAKLDVINREHGDSAANYRSDAFAFYLSGLVFEARGEWDDALIDYGKAVKSYRSDFAPFADGTPVALVRAYDRLLEKRGRTDLRNSLRKSFPQLLAGNSSALPAGMGEVAVVHQVGFIAVKQAEDFIFPYGKHLVRFSFPVIRKTSRGFGLSGIEALRIQDGGKVGLTPAELAADMDLIARQCLEDRRARMLVKSAARLIAKGQLTEEAAQSFGVLGQLLGNIFSVVTETADTRSWTLLPESYKVSRLSLPAGRHRLKIVTDGRLTDFKEVNVKAGQLVLLADF